MYESSIFNAKTLQFDYCNTSSFLNYLLKDLTINNICNMFISRFKWNGLKNINIFDEDYIEKMLLFHGCVAIFKSTEGVIVLPFQTLTTNVYGYPKKIRVFSPPTIGVKIKNDYDKELIVDNKECFILYDNPMHELPIKLINYYSNELSDISRTLSVYVRGMKKPIIVKTTFDKKSSVRKALRDQYNNDDFIVVDSEIDTVTGAGEVNFIQNSSHNSNDLTGIYEHKMRTYIEVLSLMGINCQQIIKNSQMTIEELKKNDAQVKLALSKAYKCREEAAKNLSELAQSSITCDNFVNIVEIEKNAPKIGD